MHLSAQILLALLAASAGVAAKFDGFMPQMSQEGMKLDHHNVSTNSSIMKSVQGFLQKLPQRVQNCTEDERNSPKNASIVKVVEGFFQKLPQRIQQERSALFRHFNNNSNHSDSAFLQRLHNLTDAMKKRTQNFSGNHSRPGGNIQRLHNLTDAMKKRTQNFSGNHSRPGGNIQRLHNLTDAMKKRMQNFSGNHSRPGGNIQRLHNLTDAIKKSMQNFSGNHSRPGGNMGFRAAFSRNSEGGNIGLIRGMLNSRHMNVSKEARRVESSVERFFKAQMALGRAQMELMMAMKKYTGSHVEKMCGSSVAEDPDYADEAVEGCEDD